jgi:hypothetical protein
MIQLPDNPIIDRIMRDGMPDGAHPICPVCGYECDTYFHDWGGDIVGCDVCISERDAWEEIANG